MTSHPALPPQIRLRIYKICLAEFFDTPGVWVFPAGHSLSPNYPLTWAEIQGAMIKTPIPGTLQIELGEMRPHLLAWLARQRGVFPVKNTPVLRFPERVYQSERDMLYLNNSTEICLFCRLL